MEEGGGSDGGRERDERATVTGGATQRGFAFAFAFAWLQWSEVAGGGWRLWW